MNASSSFRLMMLSSTISTLMGGTAPSSKPSGSDGCSALFLIFLLSLLFTCGRGDATLCGGGVEVLRSGCSREAGGLGRGGGTGAPFMGFETSSGLGSTLLNSDAMDQRHTVTCYVGYRCQDRWRGCVLAAILRSVSVTGAPASRRWERGSLAGVDDGD